MNHQPYETWIFSDEPLSEQHELELKSHLTECDSCKDLRMAWQQVETTFMQAPAPGPVSGFTERWQTRLSVYRQQKQQRRLWLLVFGLFAAATLIFLLLAGIHLISTPFDFALGKFLASFSLIAARIRQIITVTESLFNSFPILIPISIILGVGSLSAMLTLILTWVISVIKLYKPIHEGVTVR
jgi:hypothetical protein